VVVRIVGFLRPCHHDQEDLSRYIEEYRIKGIILHKESLEPLSRIYNLHVYAEAGSFVYATYTD
jgi:hypothetical protein